MQLIFMTFPSDSVLSLVSLYSVKCVGIAGACSLWSHIQSLPPAPLILINFICHIVLLYIDIRPWFLLLLSYVLWANIIHCKYLVNTKFWINLQNYTHIIFFHWNISLDVHFAPGCWLLTVISLFSCHPRQEYTLC